MAIEVELLGRCAKGKKAIFKLRFGETEFFIHVNQQAKDSWTTSSKVSSKFGCHMVSHTSQVGDERPWKRYKHPSPTCDV